MTITLEKTENRDIDFAKFARLEIKVNSKTIENSLPNKTQKAIEIIKDNFSLIELLTTISTRTRNCGPTHFKDQICTRQEPENSMYSDQDFREDILYIHKILTERYNNSLC